jgi:hypothetical protein
MGRRYDPVHKKGLEIRRFNPATFHKVVGPVFNQNNPAKRRDDKQNRPSQQSR